MQLTTIPFSGFYNSIHDSELDRVIEYETEYLSENGASNDLCIKIAELIYDQTDWQKAHKDYAHIYTGAWIDALNDYLKTEHKFTIKAEFESLQSPKFYNFETDRIFCTIEEKYVKALYAFAMKYHRDAFINLCEKRFTSYDGFISSYPADHNEWPRNLAEWDHNQVGILLELWGSIALVDAPEWELMEDASCNGLIDACIWDNLDKQAIKYVDAMREKFEAV